MQLKKETVSFMELAFKKKKPSFYLTHELTQFILIPSGMGHALWYLVHQFVGSTRPQLPLWCIVQCLC